MKYQLFLVNILSISVGIDGFFFSSNDDETTPVDCVWTEWADDVCFLTSSNQLRRKETRFQVPSQNGGQECVGDNFRHNKSCTHAEYMAQSFLETFSQGIISSGVRNKNTIVFNTMNVVAVSEPGVCSTPYKDPTGRWKMSGRACPSQIQGYGRSRRDIRLPPHLYTSRRQARDVVFLIDESGSVGERNFKKALRFVKETVSRLCGQIVIGPGKTKIALTTYDSEIHDHMKFYEFVRRDKVLERIDNIRYNSRTDGRTCLVNALRHLRQKIFTAAQGARLSNGVYGMVILVTDGCANCAGNIDADLQAEVDKFNEQEITFMLITVGDRTSCSDRISKLVSGNHCFLNFEMDNWDDFDDFVDAIRDDERCLSSWKVPNSTCA